MKYLPKISYTLLLLLYLAICAPPITAQDISNLLAKLETERNPIQRRELLYQIGLQYQRQEAYQKAIESFQKSLQTDANDELVMISTRRKIAECYIALQDYKNATATAEILLEYFRRTKAPYSITRTLNDLAQYTLQIPDYDKALAYNNELIEIYRNANQANELSRVYNNLGVIYRRKGNQNQSVEYFNKALDANKDQLKIKANNNDRNQTYTLLNTGVTHLQLKDFRKADYYFEEARRLAERSNDNKALAAANNYMAMSDYLQDNNTDALAYANEAKNIAEQANDSENMLAAYKILAMIYQSQDNYKEAQTYNNKYQELLAKTEKEKQQQIQKTLQNEIEIERKENELRGLLAERQRQEAALKQSELERQKQEQALKLKEQELALLKRNQELQETKLRAQALEQQRVEQLLELTRQRAETDRQKLLAEAKAQEAERQRLIAANERGQKESSQKQLELSQQRETLQKENIARQRQVQILISGLAVLILLVLVFVYFNLRRTRRLNAALSQKNQEIEQANVILKEQQEEINVQNEELHQQQEEIMSQRDVLEAVNVKLSYTNQELERTNQDLTDSITYASRIQRGILPAEAEIADTLPEHFVFYRPRDIVSGDFYWYERTRNITYIAAVDCTGHGVPGAFMSMIGSQLLTTILHEKKIYEPNRILESLSENVIYALDQQNNQSADGMDAVVCVIYPDIKIMEFAGAKNPLFYIQDGELHEIKGDKYPIGDPRFPLDRRFTLHRLEIDKPTYCYLISDGYCDQFGGDEVKKFGKKRFAQMLLDIYQRPFPEQREIIEQTINNWMQKTTERQVDDMLVIGFKVGGE